jgi:hypothetical protein
MLLRPLSPTELIPQTIPSPLTGSTGTTQFSLRDINDFPYSDFTALQGYYDELDQWYTGYALNNTQTQGNKEVEIYPLHLNPIRPAIMKHVYTLFGEIPDNHYGSLIVPKVIVRNKKPSAEQASRVENFLQDVFADNGGASLQQENAIISQVFGGCIFKVSWLPDRKDPATGRISLEKTLPEEFMCIPYMNNPWRLRKAWVIRPIDQYTAAQFGVALAGMSGWYIEAWSEDNYKISINNSPIQQQYGDDIYRLEGANPFGRVPFVYIPHERATSFWGTGIITEAVKGITKEKNLRVADAGDATSDESHSLLVMSNVRGSPTLKKIGEHIRVIDIGSGQNITGQSDPSLISVRRESLSAAMLTLTEDLHAEFRREVYVPAVADGEDEGSQRSGATLANRMWPLVSHTKGERVHWSIGMGILFNLILTMASTKKIGGIVADDLNLKVRCKWFSSLPRDREQLSAELTSRAAQDLGSIEHLTDMFGDVDDLDDDMQKRKDWEMFEAEVKKAGTPTPPPPPAGGDTTPPAPKNSTTPKKG